jgi:hypothetical protein
MRTFAALVKAHKCSGRERARGAIVEGDFDANTGDESEAKEANTSNE